jgi:DNA-binding response OmpR family regulator
MKMLRNKMSMPKNILFIDDEKDITFTIKIILEQTGLFFVDSINDPDLALKRFKPNFYALVLIDIMMPKMDGFEFSAKILELDVNIKICFMSSGLINQEALREQYPSLSIGCFIRKPLKIKDLVKRLKAELE